MNLPERTDGRPGPGSAARRPWASSACPRGSSYDTGAPQRDSYDIGVLRGFPNFLPGTVAGPVGMPSFWTAIKKLFSSITKRGARNSDLSLFPVSMVNRSRPLLQFQHRREFA